MTENFSRAFILTFTKTMKSVSIFTKTTLLLNYNWMPLRVSDAEHIITKISSGNLKCLDVNGVEWTSKEWLDAFDPNIYTVNKPELYPDQPALKSSSRLIPIPTIVIAHNNHFPKPYKGKISLRRLARFYDYQCQNCLEYFPLKELTVDHVIPQSKGGTNDPCNLVPMCKPCNSSKGDTMPYFNVDGVPIEKTVRRMSTNHIDVHPDDMREEWKPLLFKH